MAGTFDDIIRQVLSLPSESMRWDEEMNDAAPSIANVPSTGARVPADTTADVGPVTMGHWLEPLFAVQSGPDLSNEPMPEPVPTRSVEGQTRRAFERQAAGEAPQYADAMMQAVLRRQQMGRNE